MIDIIEDIFDDLWQVYKQMEPSPIVKFLQHDNLQRNLLSSYHWNICYMQWNITGPFH